MLKSFICLVFRLVLTPGVLGIDLACLFHPGWYLQWPQGSPEGPFKRDISIQSIKEILEIVWIFIRFVITCFIQKCPKNYLEASKNMSKQKSKTRSLNIFFPQKCKHVFVLYMLGNIMAQCDRHRITS